MSSIIQRIRENALEFPHSICIQDNNSAITYADLYNELNQISNGLISVLGQENKNIGVYYSRDINYLKAILAIVSAGFCFVSLSQDMPTERLKLIAKDADLSIILCDQKEAWMDCPVYNFENLKKYNTEYRTTCAAPNSHAYILYTSGTTGTPKGVVLTRENLDSAIEAFYNFFKPSKGAVFFASTSFSFDISLLELLLPLYSGGKCIILEREDVINAAELSRLLALHNPDYFQATPSQFRQLALHISSPLKKTIALCGGERMTENLAKILNELFLKSYNMYGPTETTIWAMAWLVKSPDAIELGENLQHANIAVFSIAENKKITEGTGELWISGSAVGKGYYNNPTLTNKSFIIHDGTPYYKTGDIVLLQKGKIYYQHRYDDQLKINGYRIEPGEIENLILSTGLADQVVVVPVLDDDSMPRSLHAFIKPKNNSTQNSINWGEIWDTTYGLLPKNEDEPKTQGWISAKTGENFSPETMHTWLQETVICHIGAYVSHVRSYIHHRQQNVLATYQLFRLATEAGVRNFVYLSTLATAPIQNDILKENIDPLSPLTNDSNGYILSKEVSERLISRLGKELEINTQIIRPSFVLDTEFISLNPSKTHMICFLRICIETGLLPDGHPPLLYIPLEECASIISEVTKNYEGSNIYNVSYGPAISGPHITRLLQDEGYNIALSPFDTWHAAVAKHLDENHPFQPFFSLYEKENKASPQISCENTNMLKILESLPDQTDWFKKFIRGLSKINFIPPAPHQQ